MVVVRRVVEADWAALRDIRLEMLADTPTAYLETVDDARARTEGEWRFRANRGSAGADNLGLAAVDELTGKWLGYLACFVDDAGRGHVVSVYVTPQQRGTDVATRLMDSVVGWAREEAGLDRLHLYVHEHNHRAAAFYRRYGFTETGHTMPYDLDPATVEIEMAMPLTSPTV